MKKEKLLNRVTVVVIILALLFTSVLAYNPSLLNIENASTLYASTVFDKTSIMSVNIIMDQDEWDEMLDNASAEEYYSCDIEINGTRYNNVGIRPKGNTSLSSIVSDDTTDRFSFKVEFDHYVTGQTLDGLDKLCLNNLMSDATYMKEYLSYEILSYLGVDSSLYSYASINLNGEYWGLYLAIEAVEDSFLQRTYGESDGELYKPETMGGGGGMDDTDMEDMKEQIENMSEEELEELKEQFQNGGGPGGWDNTEDTTTEGNTTESSSTDTEVAADAQQSEGSTDDSQVSTDTADTSQTMPDNSQVERQTADDNASTQSQTTTEGQPMQEDSTESATTDSEDVQAGNAGGHQMGGFNQNGGGQGGGQGGGMMGTDLAYTDDELDSYDTIWDCTIFDDITDEDKERVIEALEHITNQEDVEDYLDVDQMLRYIAANVVLLNDDSYFGSMLHNYYLYEDDGVLSMIPWDYNLAFGGFSMGSSDATDLINRAIDDVVSSGSLEDRPMLAAALSSDEYMEQYHEYLQELIDGYFTSGTFETTITQIKEMIAPYVESDPTAFYTYDEFETGVDTLLSFVNARIDSIQEQLEGTIPASASERTGDGYTLIDGSSITVSDMGTQGGGQGGGQDMGDFQMPDFNNTNATDSTDVDSAATQSTEGQSTDGTQAADGNQMQQPPGGMDGTTSDTSQMAPPDGADGTTTDTSQMQPPNGADGNMPDMSQIQGQDGTDSTTADAQATSDTGTEDASGVDTTADTEATTGDTTDGSTDTATDATQDQGAGFGNHGNMEGEAGNMMPGNSTASSGISMEAVIMTAGSIVVLLGALLFVKLYHRKKYRSK